MIDPQLQAQLSTQQQQLTEIVRTQAEVVGELKNVMLFLQEQHKSTNQRIDDFRRSSDQRHDSAEGRLDRLEDGEKKLIWKVAGASGLMAGLAALGIELFKHKLG